MCLSLPARVTEITDEGGLRMAVVDVAGVRKDACLAYTPDVRVGDYVIVHVGFAVTRVDEEDVRRTFAVLEEAGEVFQSDASTLTGGTAISASG